MSFLSSFFQEIKCKQMPLSAVLLYQILIEKSLAPKPSSYVYNDRQIITKGEKLQRMSKGQQQHVIKPTFARSGGYKARNINRHAQHPNGCCDSARLHTPAPTHMFILVCSRSHAHTRMPTPTLTCSHSHWCAGFFSHSFIHHSSLCRTIISFLTNKACVFVPHVKCILYMLDLVGGSRSFI